MTLHYYTKIPGSVPPRYTYGETHYEPVCLEALICPVDMHLQPDGTFTIDPAQLIVVRECIAGATVMTF